MEVTVGSRRFNWRHSGRDGSSFEAWKAIRGSFSQAIVEGLIGESRSLEVRRMPGPLKNLVIQLERETNKEANKMFATIVRIIDMPRSMTLGRDVPGVTLSMMQYGRTPNDRKNGSKAKLDFPKGLAPWGGSIKWKTLSVAWRNQKYKKARGTENKFFVGTTGKLKDQLEKNSESYMRQWFGGVTVSSDYAMTAGPGRRKILKDATVPEILADVQIHIFPKVAPTLFPGLASRRWTDVDTDGKLERRIVSGALMQKKLTNGFIPHKRPLLQPVAQFWLMYRIPAVIRTRLQSWIDVQSGKRD